MTTVAACIIAKNEEHTIARCLESLAGKVDYVVLSDTGSTDRTKEVATETCERLNLRLELFTDTWVDFSTNRNLTLQHANILGADYAMIVDCDDTIECTPEIAAMYRDGLDADGYFFKVYYGPLVYDRIHLIKLSKPWEYKCVLHEVLVCEGPCKRSALPAFTYRVNGGGARSSDPLKFRKDAATLEKALEADPSGPDSFRYRFYLAQSYRDANMPEEAYKNYKIRSEMGGWEEEVFISLVECGRMLVAMGADGVKVQQAFLQAATFRPARALEALVPLAAYYRSRDAHLCTILALRPFIENVGKLPTDLLFVNRTVYEWKALDEWAVASYWTGNYKEAYNACKRILTKVPPEEAERVLNNLNASEQQMVRR